MNHAGSCRFKKVVFLPYWRDRSYFQHEQVLQNGTGKEHVQAKEPIAPEIHRILKTLKQLKPAEDRFQRCPDE